MSLNFNSACCLNIAATSNSGTQISPVTWRPVNKHIVSDVFYSKKSSSALLAHEQQGSLSDALQVAIQLPVVTARGRYRIRIIKI